MEENDNVQWNWVVESLSNEFPQYEYRIEWHDTKDCLNHDETNSLEMRVQTMWSTGARPHVRNCPPVIQLAYSNISDASWHIWLKSFKK